jgi:ATP phosphoribosyltransferase
MELVEKSGLHLAETGERRLITRTLDPHVEILFARPVDIPEYVATGAADLGITGHDMVVERESDVKNCLISSPGRRKLVLAVRDDSEITQRLGACRKKGSYGIPGHHPCTISKRRTRSKCPCRWRLRSSTASRDCRCDHRPVQFGNYLRTNRLRVIDEVLTTTHVPDRKPRIAQDQEREDRRDPSRSRERDPGTGPVLPDDERETGPRLKP